MGKIAGKREGEGEIFSLKLVTFFHKVKPISKIFGDFVVSGTFKEHTKNITILNPMEEIEYLIYTPNPI